jgi:hypothetical protein
MAHEKVAPSSDKVPRVALRRYRWRKFSAQPLKWYLTSCNNNKTHYVCCSFIINNPLVVINTKLGYFCMRQPVPCRLI